MEPLTLAALDGLVERLRQNPAITNVQASPGPKPSAAALAAAAEKLPASIVAMYAEHDGYALSWETTGAVDTPTGSLHEVWQGRVSFLPLGQILGSWKGVVFVPNLRPLDFFVDEALVGLKAGDLLSYWPCAGDDTFLSLSGVQYLELLLETGGASYWQHALTQTPTDEKWFFRTLPALFPGFDPRAFLARVDAMRAQTHADIDARGRAARAALPAAVLTVHDTKAPNKARFQAMWGELKDLPQRAADLPFTCNFSTIKATGEEVAGFRALGYPEEYVTLRAKSGLRFTIGYGVNLERGVVRGGFQFSYVATHPRDSQPGSPPPAPLDAPDLAPFRGFTGLLPVTQVVDNPGAVVGALPIAIDGYLPGDASIVHCVPGEPPRRLDLGVGASMEIAIRARGLAGWQRAVHAIVEGVTDPVAEQFHADMAELFPWYSREGFAAEVAASRLSAAKAPPENKAKPKAPKRK